MIRLPDELMNNKDYGDTPCYWDCVICGFRITGQNNINVETRAYDHVEKKHNEEYKRMLQ